MTRQALAWIGSPEGDGIWGRPDALAIPLDDRGLLLADGLFETVLIEAGEPQLLTPHIARWQRSAGLLGMAPPPRVERVQQLAQEAIRRSGISRGALRLNWSRGGGERGLAPATNTPSPATGGRFWLQLSEARPSFGPITAIVSPTERRCATSLLSRCKTFAYGPSIQARRQAATAGADDALLESTAGGLCCATTANLLVQQDGRWFTPPLASGCLPGVMRQRALELGLLVEAGEPIEPNAVSEGRVSAAWLINSLGCRPLLSLNGHGLHRCDPVEARQYWQRLLSP